MLRSNLTLVVIVFVIAAALLPQALFAQERVVCADDSDPSTCVVVRQERRPADTLQAQIRAHAATYPSARLSPAAQLQAQVRAHAATYPSAASGLARGKTVPIAEVHPSVTAGAAGLGQAAPAPARHTPSGGYGPYHSDQ